MKILVTGARGKLGSEVVKCFSSKGLNVVSYSHSMNLAELDWNNIDIIVNCAAVIPSENVTQEEYLDGNVFFLQKLLKYSKGKVFIHFSTFSELYKDDFYQKSKMIANSLLLINLGVFKDLKILPLPTLEDDQLINKIVGLASAGSTPKVDRLKYNYMSFKDVAKFLKNIVVNRSNIFISDFYVKKDLYDEVVKRVDAGLVVEGRLVDRVLLDSGVYQVMPEMIESLSK